MFNTDTYDIGDVKAYSSHEYEFVYEGDKEIRSVKASCGCTSAFVRAKDGEPTKVSGKISVGASNLFITFVNKFIFMT